MNEESLLLVAELFDRLNYNWKFKTGSRIPTSDELTSTLDKAKEALYDEPDQAQLSIGHLVVKKDQGHYDVYVHVGEV